MNSFITFILQKIKNHLLLNLVITLFLIRITERTFDLSSYRNTLLNWKHFYSFNQLAEFLHFVLFTSLKLLSVLTLFTLIIYMVTYILRDRIKTFEKYEEPLGKLSTTGILYIYHFFKSLVIIRLAGNFIENKIIMDFWEHYTFDFSSLPMIMAVFFSAILLVGEFNTAYINSSKLNLPD